MTRAARHTISLLTTILLLGAGGCFTGVESTPRIDSSDVRRKQAEGITPEQLFLAALRPEAPARWQRGRRLRVANDRISLVFTAASDNTSGLGGHDIFFDSFVPARSLTGDDAMDAVFVSDDGRRLVYRVPDMSQARLDTLWRLDVPFTIDLDLVARADSAMRRQHYYVRTPMWYNPVKREAVSGLRHVEVSIDSVVPGNENFPLAVFFSIVDPALRAKACPDGANRLVLMSLGSTRAATRNFDTLFAFEDPRREHPEIKDDVWQLIIASKVREGMTRDECRLALGAPPSLERIPTYAGMVERWTYSDGVFLIFEDGYLTRFRQ